MRRAHYLVICGVVASAGAAYLLGGGAFQGGQETSEWCAPVRAADRDGRGGAQGRRPAPDGPAERLAARLLAERYGIAEPVVAQALGEGDSFAEVALAANLATRVGRPFEEVRRLRQGGEAWDAIARRFGLSGVMLTEPVLPALSAGDEALIRETLGRQYRIPELVVGRLRREGFAAGDILVAAALTGGGEAEVTEALNARRRGQEWQSAVSGPAGRPAAAPSTPGDALSRRGDGEITAESAAYCRALLTEFYGLRTQDVDAAAGRGLPWMDLLIAANTAARSGRPFGQVVSLRGEGSSWRAIEQRLGLAAGESVKLPAPSVRRAARKPVDATRERD